MSRLPIHAFEKEIKQSLTAGNRLVLAAPTGSGKSTQVPKMARDAVGDGGRVLVLQPRRIAARMLAARVASEMGTRLGDVVGYRTRYDSKASTHTRILYVTEGILPRMILSDSALRGVGTVILDEFHERSITTDLGLGLVRRLQESARTDLRLVVMSATIDVGILGDYLADARTITCEGRSYPIEISYEPAAGNRPVWERASRVLQGIMRTGIEGDVLIFMPGAFEINRTISAIRDMSLPEPVAVLPLYGSLPTDQQDCIMAPTDRRKVVVATNIAETSLTIPGIRCVIDAGLARIHRYDPHRGINTLELEPISQASADQRAGRAGREAPGRCVRLWSAAEHRRRPEHTDPEVRRIDLAETALYLRCTGFPDITRFPWLEAPDQAAIAAAQAVIHLLGAVDPRSDKLTALGRRIVAFPAHPRLARMLIDAGESGCLRTAATIAAMISERPFTMSDAKSRRVFIKHFGQSGSAGGTGDEDVDSDFFMMADALAFAENAKFNLDACRRSGIRAGAAREVCRATGLFLQIAERNGLYAASHAPRDNGAVIRAILAAYPDHLARRRDKGSLICELADGRRGELSRSSVVRDAELLVAVEIRQAQRKGEGRRVELSLASEVAIEWLIDMYPDDWEFAKTPVWNERTKAVELHVVDRCLSLVVNEQRTPDVDPDVAGRLLADEVLRDVTVLTSWNKDVKEWIRRVQAVAEWFPEREIPGYTEDDIRSVITSLCAGKRRLKDVESKPLLPWVRGFLMTPQQHFVESMAPAELRLPSGRKMRLRYAPGKPPRGNAKIQDLYGLTATPTVGAGRKPVLLEILGPNMRPVQVTDDLAGFWQNLYPELKKSLSRRYPKHDWR